MKVKKFSNNLRLVVNTKKDTDIVSFKIFVNAGAKDEKQTEYGYAHFLEHMFFKSTKNHSYADLLKKLDNLGATKNAYTSESNTCYYFKSLTNTLEDCVKLYSEMFFNTSFNTLEIEKEKQVILEEYKMVEDEPVKKCVRLAYENMFTNTIYNHDTIGTPESIKSVTAKKLLAFKKRMYTPQNIVISISGNISLKTATKLVEKYFIKNLQNTAIQYKKTKYFSLCPSKKYIAFKKDNEQSVVYIIADLKQQSIHKQIVFRFLFAIIGSGMSSKFFEILRGEKGLVYNIDAGCTRIGQNFLYEIFLATSNENVCNALSEINNILKDCANGNISNDELVRTKNNFVAEMVFASESNSNIAEANGLDMLEFNRVISNTELKKEYMSVTLEEVIECAKFVYENKNFVVSSVGLCTTKDLKCFN